MIKKIALAFALLLLTSSCTFDAEGLMKAPKPPILIERLKDPLSRLVDDKTEYASPEAGNSRQAVQTKDLDGDGTEEAIVFLRSKADRTLSVHILTLVDDEYVQTGLITNEADAIYSVAYSDLTGDGRLELIIGWRKESLRLLTVHAVDGAAVQLMYSDYTEYALIDINGDNNDELMVIRLNAPQLEGTVELYGYVDGLLEPASSAPLSMGVSELRRSRNGMLVDGESALFVTCRNDKGEYITDIITLRSGELANISLVIEHGASVYTVSNLEMYPSDINSDGIIELPIPQQLPPYDAYEENVDPIYTYLWKNYDSSGRAYDVFETYHSTSGSWYFVMPSEWSGQITARRTDVAVGRRVVVFSYLQPDMSPVDLLSLQAIQKTAGTTIDPEGKILITERANLAIFAEINPSAPNVGGFELTREELVKRTFFITADWLAGN